MAGTALGLSPYSGRTGGTKTVGILLIVIGLLAIFLPLVAGIAITAVVGWLLLLAGGAHLFYGWHQRSTGAVIWQLVLGALYLLVGFYLILHPERALVTLTLLLASYFVIEGILELITYFRMRHFQRANWFLWNGIVTLFLGGLIWKQWPFSSIWALGTLVGISLLFSGVARLSFHTNQPTLTGPA